MSAQTFIVAVNPYGERHRAVVVSVNAGRAAEVEARLAAGDDAMADELLIEVAVRDTPREAVVRAVEMATGEIADELGHTS